MLKKEKSISSFLNTEYMEYGMYVIEQRAIPSLIDGLKPTQRKIMHIANKSWPTGSGKAMKVFQIAGRIASECFYHHGDCLKYDTIIQLSDKTYITIGEWYDQYPDKKFLVECYDEQNNKIAISTAHTPRIGHITDEYYEIELEDGTIISCTANHPFLVAENWLFAEELNKDMKLQTISDNINIKQVLKIKLGNPISFYDITVDDFHNFPLTKNGVITHNSSLQGAIITLAQDFKNNVPLLKKDGQFGDLRSPAAAAARYVGVSISNDFKKIYKDFELLKSRYEEDVEIEPYYFLPIIPMVLVNGANGIAVGYNTVILNRDVNDVIKTCLDWLEDKKITKYLKPKLNVFKGKYLQDKEILNKWYMEGLFEIQNTTTVRVTELPPSMTYEKWEELLENLIDKKEIVDYVDNSIGLNVDYVIKFTRENLNNHTEDSLKKLLKLVDSQTEYYNTLDEKGKLKIFDNTFDIFDYFMKFRLNYYNLRKEYLIDKYEKDIKNLSNKAIFVKSIIEKEIVVFKKPKDKLLKELEELKFDKIEESFDYLIRMPISSFTKEVYEKLLKDDKDKKQELLTIQKLDPKQMYKDDLVTLSIDIKKTI